MSPTQLVDSYKIHSLAASLLGNRLTSDEFQKECRRLTELERRALYERLEELKRGQRG